MPTTGPLCMSPSKPSCLRLASSPIARAAQVCETANAAPPAEPCRIPPSSWQPAPRKPAGFPAPLHPTPGPLPALPLAQSWQCTWTHTKVSHVETEPARLVSLLASALGLLNQQPHTTTGLTAPWEAPSSRKQASGNGEPPCPRFHRSCALESPDATRPRPGGTYAPDVCRMCQGLASIVIVQPVVEIGSKMGYNRSS
jgi:hypothetical protein